MSKNKRSLSRQRPSGMSNADLIHSNSLTNMYFNDWTSDVLPFVFRDSGKNFKVQVSPEDQRRFITTLLNVRGPDNETVEESLSEFVKEISQSLILYNGAAYELCEIEEQSRVIHVLNFVPRETLDTTDSEVIQTLLEDGKIHINRIEKSKVLLIDPPCWIEGGAGFPATIESLLSLSNHEFNPIKFFEKQSKGETTFFDYAKFREYQDVEVLRDTRQSGWLRRGRYLEKMTEFYDFVRYLRFKRAQAQLRDYIMKAINDFLSSLEKHGFSKIKLDIEGVPSVTEIEKLASDLDAGEIGFQEIVNQFKNS